MKVIRSLFFVVLLTCFCACGNKPYPRAMQMADSLVNAHPDSALVLLEQLKGSIEEEPEATQMYYQLLTIKAEDKACITHTSDSIIKKVVNYYRKGKDEKYLPEAYYHAGRVCRDLGDAPQALEYFQEAIETSKKSTDYKLIGLMYNQIGMLYLYQDIYIESLDNFKKSSHFAELSGDSTLLSYTLRDIGRAFTGLNNVDSTLYYYKKAEQTARKINNINLAGIINQEVAGIYTQLGEFEKAHNAIQSSLYSSERIYAAYYATLAEFYHGTGKADSAQYYYTKSLSTGNHYHKQGGYKGLSKIARQQGRYVEAFGYMDKYLAYTDSIHKMTDAEVFQKVNALYNYQLREKENYQLEAVARRQKSWITVLIASLFITALTIVGICIIYHQYKRQRQMQIDQLQERHKRIEEEQYYNSQQHVLENEKRIEEMRKLLDSECQKGNIRNILQKSEKELLELTNKQIEIRQKIQAISETALKESQIYKDFRHVAGLEGFEDKSEKKNITAEDWIMLAEILDQTYNNFTQRLQTFYPNMSKQELYISMLIKIDIPIFGIATLIARSKQAVSSARKMLYEKTHNQQSTPNQWDDFIKRF